MRDIREIEARYKRREESKGKINLLKKRYILIFVLFVAFITNPSKEKHRNTIKKQIDAVMGINTNYRENVSEYDDFLLDQVVDSYMNYSNYLLFSTISADYQGKTRVIGFGMLGYVYIPQKVEEALLNYKR